MHDDVCRVRVRVRVTYVGHAVAAQLPRQHVLVHVNQHVDAVGLG